MNWGQEKCLELIDNYEKYPVLWNPKHGLYYNKIKKHDAWVSISDDIGCSTVDTKKKMESLLASFRREKAKGKESIGTGKGRQEIYVSKWFAFPRLAFLLDRDEPRTTINSLENEQEDDDPDELNIPSEIETEEQEEVENNDGETIQQQNSQKRNRSTTLNKTFKKKTQEVSKIDEAFDLLKSVADRPKSQEICDSSTDFGKHVANKMRTYSERARCVAQYQINNILFQADMGHFDEYNRPTIMTYNPNSPFESYSAPSSMASTNNSTPIPTPSPQGLHKDNKQCPSQEDTYISAANYLRNWNSMNK